MIPVSHNNTASITNSEYFIGYVIVRLQIYTSITQNIASITNSTLLVILLCDKSFLQESHNNIASITNSEYFIGYVIVR